MKLTCVGTKKSPTYYVQKSVRIGNKTTTKLSNASAALKKSKPDVGIRVLPNGLKNIQKAYAC